VHFRRNALAYVPKTQETVVAAAIRQAFIQPDRETAGQIWRHVADQLRPRFEKLGRQMDDAEHDGLAYMTFAAQHRTKLHSTNPLERLNKEVKRRADVVGIFPNEESIVRLVGAVLMEQNDDWQTQNRSMQVEGFAEPADKIADLKPLQITPKAPRPMTASATPENYTTLTHVTPRPPVTRTRPCFPVLTRTAVAPSGHSVSKPLDICPRHGGKLLCAQQRLDVPLDTPLVADQRARLLCDLATRQDPPCPAAFEIGVAKLADSSGLPRLLFRSRGIAALHSLAKDPPRFVSGQLRGPRCSMLTDSSPALPAVCCAIFDYICDRIACLATGTQARHCSPPFIPYSRVPRHSGDGFQRDHEPAPNGSY
jgi:hypothetical protein